ncbi:MAG: aminotransferase class I/II-fold pyridoxal phosphate-dependent enzyme [Rhodospirillales bacterium]|nr:aminotransferase class I/II-fold pyridoxal phosphate-dependent enzyme [Rhodospirillales bacterium]
MRRSIVTARSSRPRGRSPRCRSNAELERRLADIFERPVIVTPSTTLGHLAALPTIVAEHDAVIVDLQVHTSVQMAVQMLKADGVRVEVIRHNSMTALERKLVDLKGKHEKVWYLADGVYSIFGDTAPLAELEALLDRHPHLHLYIDDAHGMGWTGKHGRGWVRSHMDHHPRMVLAVSLNKSFACAGGCLVFPDQALADRVAVLNKGRLIAIGSVDEMRALVARKRISCASTVSVDDVKSWPGVVEAVREEKLVHVTASDAESVVQRLFVADRGLRQLEVKQASLAEAFTELTKEAA